MHVLVGEAMKKAAIIWVSPDEARPAYPLWCLGIGDALYVVTGGNEQPAPGLAESGAAAVTARGDHGGRIATWRVRVEPVTPAGDDWSAIAPALAGKRLNGAADLVAAWATTATILRLAPADDEIEPPTSDAGAAIPVRVDPGVMHATRRRDCN